MAPPSTSGSKPRRRTSSRTSPSTTPSACTVTGTCLPAGATRTRRNTGKGAEISHVHSARLGTFCDLWTANQTWDSRNHTCTGRRTRGEPGRVQTRVNDDNRTRLRSRRFGMAQGHRWLPRALVVAGLGGALLVVQAPDALASCHAFTVSASPSTVAEGGTVTVTVTRDGNVRES